MCSREHSRALNSERRRRYVNAPRARYEALCGEIFGQPPAVELDAAAEIIDARLFGKLRP
jgi:hypothetical protein